MTVKEFIKQLENYNENLQVYRGYWESDGLGWHTLTTDGNCEPKIVEDCFVSEYGEIKERFLIIG